jgi:hypothetical protein
MIEEKVTAYKAIADQIKALEAQKQALSKEILNLMPEDTKLLQVGDYNVRRASILSVKGVSLEDARFFDAIKEVVDKDKIKTLHEIGHPVPGVSETHFITISKAKKRVD